MAKAKSYKQPKMKQKDYFEALERQKSLEYLYGEPRSLHQLKQQRGGVGLVKRSSSDVSYRSAPPSLQPAFVYKNNTNNNNIVKRSSSDVNYRQKSSKQSTKRTPSFKQTVNEHIYPGNAVQRSVSDSIQLVQYRNNYANVSRNNSMVARPSSANVQRPRKYPSRPASADLTPRPRSILKKSSSSNDLHLNRSFEEDLIFDDEYLDYVSPRDVLIKGNEDNRNLNFSFEDELSRNHLTHTRPISPKSEKRVNFNNELTFYRNLKQQNDKTETRTKYFREPKIKTAPKQFKALPPQLDYSNQAQNIDQHYLNSHIEQNHYSGDKNKQPYELRKPLFGENNVVDFGTFISKKLSKLKFKNRKKEKGHSKENINGNEYGSHNINGNDYGSHDRMRRSNDGNFTLVPRRQKGSPPLTKEDFMTEEILY